MGSAQAQGKITGVALDSVTNEPLAFASVFLANTTLGATTTEQGKFEFARVPAGTYDIVGSYVGYRLSKQSVTVGPTPQQVTLRLAPTGNQLGEVVVKPAPNKPEEYEKFSKLFLGGTTFSEQCRISNPDQVRVLYDDSTKELTVRAKEFVQIDNEALGYRLKYYGLDFNYDEESGSISYYGQPVFEEIKPRDDKQRRQWAANRATAYRGSFMHFLRSVYTNRMQAEGFMAQQVKVVYHPQYERAQELRRILVEKKPDGPFTAAEEDSLSRWDAMAPVSATLNPAPLPIDSVRRVSADGRRTYLRFNGELQVAYFGEAPDPRYKKRMSPLGSVPGKTFPVQRQVSRLKLRGRQAEIQANGSLMNPLDAYNGEYWGFERIGEFLPVDYAPTTAAGAAPASSAPPAKASSR
ncbi:carboxypeptidase-like regulatory domain-containing protein [Hymenobacter arizonensis]|uniref:CarboxypepD_reg-like domain-containing protein n=1 Tax=Hymenobacter arizonensis TaxID=1227077 RepID=A0A1I6AVT8_HYMAR|nr:carboxypeptidase-like regulatory domain-containing protein [Hymenobacter arizonensis]SFQ72804.1 CarboxypepD_reg-like domain-containing protein [Hymenobacter arizonensis]